MEGISLGQSIFISYSTAYKYVFNKKDYIPRRVALVKI